MDIRNKLPFYPSDFTDCASLQCIAATLYLYLVCLCSVVAFGGMLGYATDNYMVRFFFNCRRNIDKKKCLIGNWFSLLVNSYKSIDSCNNFPSVEKKMNVYVYI